MDTEDLRNMRAPKIEIIGATTLGGNSGKSTSKSILKKGDSTMNTKKRLAFWDDNYNSSPQLKADEVEEMKLDKTP